MSPILISSCLWVYVKLHSHNNRYKYILQKSKQVYIRAFGHLHNIFLGHFLKYLLLRVSVVEIKGDMNFKKCLKICGTQR